MIKNIFWITFLISFSICSLQASKIYDILENYSAEDIEIKSKKIALEKLSQKQAPLPFEEEYNSENNDYFNEQYEQALIILKNEWIQSVKKKIIPLIDYRKEKVYKPLLQQLELIEEKNNKSVRKILYIFNEKIDKLNHIYFNFFETQDLQMIPSLLKSFNTYTRLVKGRDIIEARKYATEKHLMYKNILDDLRVNNLISKIDLVAYINSSVIKEINKNLQENLNKEKQLYQNNLLLLKDCVLKINDSLNCSLNAQITIPLGGRLGSFLDWMNCHVLKPLEEIEKNISISLEKFQISGINHIQTLGHLTSVEESLKLQLLADVNDLLKRTESEIKNALTYNYSKLLELMTALYKIVDSKVEARIVSNSNNTKLSDWINIVVITPLQSFKIKLDNSQKNFKIFRVNSIESFFTQPLIIEHWLELKANKWLVRSDFYNQLRNPKPLSYKDWVNKLLEGKKIENKGNLFIG